MSGIGPSNVATTITTSLSKPTVFDVLTQIWPYLEVYERLSIRQCCREGLQRHDSLLSILSVHDLWGRVLPSAPEEMNAGLSRMVRRGCRPATLILRLKCGTPTARQARGLAVLRAFTCLSCSSTVTDGASITTPVGNGTGSPLAGGPLVSVRLEGVPLTARVLRALAAAAPALASLKLYSYDLRQRSQRPPMEFKPSTVDEQAEHLDSETHGSLLEGQRLEKPHDGRADCRQPAPRLDAAVQGRSPAGGPGALAPAGTGAPADVGSLGSRGVPALLAVVAPTLVELTLQDCHLGSQSDRSFVCSGGDGSGGIDSAESGTSGSASSVPSGGRDGGDGACSPGGAAVAPEPGIRTNSPCGGRAAAGAAAPFVVALRGCGRLRHLGLRHHGRCPVLSHLLGLPAELALGLGTQASPVTGVSCNSAGRNLDSSCPSGTGGLGVGSSQRPLPLLAGLTSLTSVKLQTQLPWDLEAGGTGVHGEDGGGEGGATALLAAALAHLTGLTRLELGSRTAVKSLPAVLIGPTAVPTLSRLRDLDIGTAQVLAPADLVVLAGLTELTRLAVGAILPVPAELASVPQAPQHLLGAIADAYYDGGGGPNDGSPGGGAGGGFLPLPPRLVELSVAAPLAPSTLLALRRPACLRVLRTTGFTLGPKDAAPLADDQDPENPVAAATAAAIAAAMAAAGPGAGALGLNLGLMGLGLGPGQGPGSSLHHQAVYDPPACMLPSACDALAAAVGLLQGRFAYRDLGIELHIGFHDSAPTALVTGPGATAGQGPERGRSQRPRRRQYLAAPTDRPGGHWTWAARLRSLALQGLELAGLELTAGDVEAMSQQLGSLEDLRLDCRYPLSSLPSLAGLRRLRRLLLNASFWHLQPPPAHDAGGQEGPGHPPPPPPPLSGGAVHHRTAADDPHHLDLRARAAGALHQLCAAAPECLYDMALASHGRAPARLVAMWAVVRVEDELPRVGCGALRVWVCP